MNRRERELLFEKLVRRARREGGLPRPDEAWRMSTLQAVARTSRTESSEDSESVLIVWTKGLCALSATVVLGFYFWIGPRTSELRAEEFPSLTDAAWLSLL